MLEELKAFCDAHERIYLYGAGLHAELLFDILRRMDISVSGFITSQYEKKEYHELPVYVAENITTKLTEQDGIIPAFNTADINQLHDMFKESRPGIFPLDQNVMLMESRYIEIPEFLDFLESKYNKARVWKDKTEISEILVVRTDVIGDVVCTIPFIRELRRNYPLAHISLIVCELAFPIVKSCPYVDVVKVYHAERKDGEFHEQCKDFEKAELSIKTFLDENFSNTSFDAVFLPRELFAGRNMIDDILFAFCCGARYRVGHMIAYPTLYQHSVYQKLLKKIKDKFSFVQIADIAMHESAYHLDMLRASGLAVVDDGLELWVEKEDKNFAEKYLSQFIKTRKIKLIAVGIVGSEKVKNWNIENYEELFASFQRKYKMKLIFLILGGQDATESASKIHMNNVIDLTGKLDLGKTMAVIDCCDMYVGSDTGLMNIAVALKKPAVVLHYKLDDEEDVMSCGPVRWGAHGVKNVALLPPSGFEGCRGICRKKYSHCINLIKPCEVRDAIETLLGESNEG